MNPPVPFTARVVSDVVGLAEFEVEEDGVKTEPCARCDAPFKGVYVTLR